MMCLTLVIHESAKQDLIDHLLQRDDIDGFTLTPAEGHSRKTRGNPFETTRDVVLGYVPRVRVEILVRDADLPGVREEICVCDSCVSGRGVWWVTAVQDWGTL